MMTSRDQAVSSSSSHTSPIQPVGQQSTAARRMRPTILHSSSTVSPQKKTAATLGDDHTHFFRVSRTRCKTVHIPGPCTPAPGSLKASTPHGVDGSRVAMMSRWGSSKSSLGSYSTLPSSVWRRVRVQAKERRGDPRPWLRQHTNLAIATLPSQSVRVSSRADE
ncbi:hypothetical protein BC827DRAFT_868839 [Russula dissimulans]|nr:hypothetical protein BC827DRAFT_868839 [Russula dissimulans]